VHVCFHFKCNLFIVTILPHYMFQLYTAIIKWCMLNYCTVCQNYILHINTLFFTLFILTCWYDHKTANTTLKQRTLKWTCAHSLMPHADWFTKDTTCDTLWLITVLRAFYMQHRNDSNFWVVPHINKINENTEISYVSGCIYFRHLWHHCHL
jgi:hypothetical protein